MAIVAPARKTPVSLADGTDPSLDFSGASASTDTFDLADKARLALRRHPATRGVAVIVEERGGTVTLRGMVRHEVEREATGQVVAAIPGVVRVRNELRAIYAPHFHFNFGSF